LSQSSLFTRAFLSSQSGGHDITLTIFEPKWHSQCTRLSFRWAKSSLRMSLHSGRSGTTKKIHHITGLTVSYSVHCQDWFIHYGMNDQCITMSPWLLFGRNQVVWNKLAPIPSSEKCLDGMPQSLNSANLIF